MLNWMLVICGIAGAMFNIFQKRIGFLIWILSNCGFVALNLIGKNYAQATLFFVYMSLSLWGLIKWGKN
jgi:hypothetical protein